MTEHDSIRHNRTGQDMTDYDGWNELIKVYNYEFNKTTILNKDNLTRLMVIIDENLQNKKYKDAFYLLIKLLSNCTKLGELIDYILHYKKYIDENFYEENV